ncbi:MAG: type VI secretion system tip protein VgrG [Deltaproteobacteria bacterium]|nr:type VI secretion system tip protein VgrG [Deltaproteobacteria bacterium]
MSIPIQNVVLECADLSPAHVLTGFALTESLSDGYRGQIGLVAQGAPVDPEALLGKKASLLFLFEDGSQRAFHGDVCSVRVTASHSESFLVLLELAARIERLKVGRSCRIFQDQSIKDIVLLLLEEAGLSGDSAVAWTASAGATPHPFVAQYNESDFAFISRLLVEEGIGFAVHNDASNDVVLFFDDSSTLPMLEGEADLFDRDAQTDLRPGSVFWELRDTHAAVSDEAMRRDYDFKNPSADLDATAKAPSSTGREVYEHPGNYKLKSPDGKRLVARMLERLQLGKRLARGHSSCPRLEPGRYFTAQLHARPAMNTDHLVLRVAHQASSVGDDLHTLTLVYECEITTVAKGVQFRPRAASPPPRLGGVHTAIVTTPGEDIEVDDSGCVKVRFPWDRRGILDDKSSTGLRVGQLALGGSMIHPRKDFEVIVDFELGDIDRPFVTGHLYHGELRPPYPLPDGKVITTMQSATTGGSGGANEIRYNMTAGSEEMFINASKDSNTSIENMSSANVGKNQTMTIGANHTVSVGDNFTARVTSNRKLTISSNQGINVTADYSHTVGGSKTITVDGTRKVTVGGDHAENVKTTLDRTVDSMQCVTGITGYTRKVLGSSTTNCSIWMEIANARASSSASRNESVSALKFIKTKNFSMSSVGAYSLTCANQDVKCSGSRTDQAGAALGVAASSMKVKAKNIVVSAESSIKVVIPGILITLKSSGEVKISANKVDLTGVKTFSQLKFEAN